MDPKDALPAEWPDLDVEQMLRRLAEASVDFVVIGGIALVLSGSARLTRDLDIVFASDPENLEHLGRVLVDLGAQLRDVEEDVPFVPDERALANVRLLTLATDAGWLDVHREVAGVRSYEALRDAAQQVELGGFTVNVASLDDLIAMKRAAGRPQDLVDVAELETIRRLRSRAS